MEEPTRPLLLTGLEVVFLCDSIKNDELAQGLPDPNAKIPIARITLLLLASAYTEVVNMTGIDPGPILLEITEEQAWLFRSKTVTGSMAFDGKTNIGVALLLKLYGLIIRFKYGEGPEVDEGEEEPSLSQDIKQKLEEFNAGSSKDPHTNQDDGSNDGAGEKDGSGEVMPGSENENNKDCSTNSSVDYENY